MVPTLRAPGQKTMRWTELQNVKKVLREKIRRGKEGGGTERRPSLKAGFAHGVTPTPFELGEKGRSDIPNQEGTAIWEWHGLWGKNSRPRAAVLEKHGDARD